MASELEEFFDLSIDPLCILDFEGRFKRVNASLARTLGYSREHLLARTAFDITHPADVERAREALARQAGGQNLIGFEARVIRADGSVRWLEWDTRATPERGVIYGVARDITERRRADAALREAQRMLEAGRDELRVLAAEQAALRRVATLVAQDTPPEAVFAAVGREIGEALGVDATHLGRFDPDGTVVSVAQWGTSASLPIGGRYPIEGDSVSARVLQTRRPARMDGYDEAPGLIAAAVREFGIRFAIGVPILIEGRPWGVMIASSKGEQPFAPKAEARLRDFTELLATAIANAEARAEVTRLAAEQAALRRVATLVAQGPAPSAVFDAVTAEAAELLSASAVTLARYDDDVLTVIAQHGMTTYVGIGERFPLGGANVTSTVLRTGRTARMDGYAQATGPIGDVARRSGIRSTVAAAVVVEGRTWGVLVAVWAEHGAAPDDAESRIARFAELLGTAIANADSRAQLTASRARVLAAGDEARRRVVRDLHDGAQQRLVQTIAMLRLHQRALDEDGREAPGLLAAALETAERAMDELRELGHGIVPSVLAHGGLRAAIKAFVSRLDLAVAVDVTSERLAPHVEASAYFILAEALANVVEQARASRAAVHAAIEGGTLILEVRDDGEVRAHPDGHRLLAIADRVDALGGRLAIESAGGTETVMTARIPLTGLPHAEPLTGMASGASEQPPQEAQHAAEQAFEQTEDADEEPAYDGS